VPVLDTQLPIISAALRACAVIAAVIAAQTLGPSDALPDALCTVLAAWQGARTRHPLALATACAFALYASADALSQCAAARRPARSTMTLDVRRLLRTGLTASFLSGFLAVFYFAWLDRALSPRGWHWARLAGGGVRQLAQWASIFGKIAVDVGVYEPLYDTCYITLQALLRGEGVHVAAREVRRKVFHVWKMAPRYWCVADLLTFGLVPLRLRPTSNALLSIPWGMYISSVANAG